MSSRSRARRYLELPIAPDDRIVALADGEREYDGELIATCASGRRFAVRRVAKWKRAYKVREIAPAGGPQGEQE